MKIPVFEVSDKVRLKPAGSDIETSYNIEILQRAKLTTILSR